MWRMLGFVRPLAGVMVVSVVCGVAGFCCATGIPVLAAEEVFALAGAGSLAWPLATVCWVLAAMALARGVFHYVEQRCNHYIAFRLLAHIRDLVFGALRKLAPAKLAGRDRGSLVSTVTSDVELLEVFFAHTISPICIAVLMATPAAGSATLRGRSPATCWTASAAWARCCSLVPARLASTGLTPARASWLARSARCAGLVRAGLLP
jgi:ABC-type transport system involved in cytochrome bd biosynthesis fused ATPase/permease subunit